MHALIQRRARLAIALLMFTLVAVAAPSLRADVYPRQAGIKILHYAFDITLNDANDEFVVIDTVEMQFVNAGVTTVELDLYKFSAQPRNATMANGFADPCAEPGGGRGQAAAVAHRLNIGRPAR